MGRLQPEFLERTESFADRILEVCKSLQARRCFNRIVDQLVGAGTSVGANVFEADEAMTTADFVRCVAVAAKELNETRFWLRLVARQGWLPAGRLVALEEEALELKKILGSMIARSKRAMQVRKATGSR